VALHGLVGKYKRYWWTNCL